ncbi:CD63 antigen [Chironomus tepperi]|uniref:CD63 antigen n=1 Tax=Chironomus tepperi TaxID=113505 RepID=UPI00391EE973
MPDSETCIKYTLFIFNFFFVITGIIILSVGLTVQGIYHGYSEFLSSQFLSLPVFLIVIGSIIFFVAFFGCYGAWRSNYCMILTFCGLLTIIFILELAAGITGYILKNSTSSLITDTLQPTMKDYINNEKPHISVAWDDIQSRFGCCGLQNYQDWVTEIKGIPLSCCEIPHGILNSFTCSNETTTLHEIGCVASFGSFVQEHARSLALAGIILAIVQLFGLLFACMVARRIKYHRIAGY